MRSLLSGKNRVLLLALLGLLAIAVLASGLREVSFNKGLIMGDRDAQMVSAPVANLMQNISTIPVWKQLVAWAIIFLIVLISSLLLSPAMRLRLIKMFLRLSLTLACLYFLATSFPDLFKGLLLFNRQDTVVVDPSPEGAVPPPAFQPPQISSVTVFLIGLGVALVLALVLWAARRWWLRHQEELRRRRPMDELAGIARQSLDDLSAGHSWDDVIVESYFRMSEVIERRQGLARHHAVTPSEFAAALERAGLPGDAVHTLTHLFERVRYGARRSSNDEISQAVACLTAIRNYCGEAQ
jgi:hypothetical protein